LEERYVDDSAYVAAVKSTAARFVNEGLLLQEDADRAVIRAQTNKLSQLN
jgi:hypothetical protein